MSSIHRRLLDVEPRMNHREARALFLALADDELPAPKAQAVRTHLDGCADCREGWEGYARTVQRLKGGAFSRSTPLRRCRVCA